MTLLRSSFSIERIKLVLSGWGHSRSLSSTSMSPSLWLHWILVQMWIAHAASQTVVRGVTGQSVTLPCFYRVARASDVTAMCWGQGRCPNSKCSNEIVRTDGLRVISSKSVRYQLTNRLGIGDVSLTIRNVDEGDGGIYCCRVEVPGWFNDIKQNLELKVERAVTTPRRPPRPLPPPPRPRPRPPPTTAPVPAVVTTHPAMPPAFPTDPALPDTTLAPQTTALETTDAWPGRHGVTELDRTLGLMTTPPPPRPPTTTAPVPAVVTTHPAMPPAFPTDPALPDTTLAPQATALETTDAWPGRYGVTELYRTLGRIPDYVDASPSTERAESDDFALVTEGALHTAITTPPPPRPSATTALVPAVVTTHPAMPPAFPTGPALPDTTLAPQTTALETTDAWLGCYGMTELDRTLGWFIPWFYDSYLTHSTKSLFITGTDPPATVQDPPEQMAVDSSSYAPFSTRDTPVYTLAADRETSPESQHGEPPENTDHLGQLEQGIPVLPLATGGAVVLLALMLLLLYLWRCQHKRKYQLTVTESTAPSEEPEKAFSGVEGENGLFTL